MQRSDYSLPQARQEDILIQELPDETLVYDLKRHKAHCLNQTAALIWRQCDGQTTVAEITAILEQRLGAPLDEEAVWFAVDGLGKARLLQEKIAQPAKMTGVSRREVIRRIGIGAAIAAPLIVTIIAPEAAQAASCRQAGALCTVNSQCCSNQCQSDNGQLRCQP